MTMPDGFKRFCRGFHQGIDDYASTIDGMVEIAMLFIEPSDVPEVKAYLDELLSDRYDGKQLLEIWNRSPADIYFRDDVELRLVLESARSAIDTHPNLMLPESK